MATHASTLFATSTLSGKGVVLRKQSHALSFIPSKSAAAAKPSSSSRQLNVSASTAEAPVGFTPPELDQSTPPPIFSGSTGGLLRKAQVEEFYVMTWESSKEQIFECPPVVQLL